jgi:hypothetical protein
MRRVRRRITNKGSRPAYARHACLYTTHWSIHADLVVIPLEAFGVGADEELTQTVDFG